jgi:putative membrane protein
MQWWCAAQGIPWTWSWQPYPGVWAFCLGLAAIWARMRVRWPGAEETKGRAAIFLAGVATLWIALDWPVGALGAGYLASVHMVQYLLIALVAPPLLLIGTPRGAYAALVSGPLGGFVRTLTHPIVSMTTFVSIMGVTHWPWLVDTWMATQLGSFGLDLLWLFSGIVFWWPVSAPAPARDWLTDGTRIGYLIIATLVNTGVFAYLAFTELPLYATYELAPPVGTISSRDDQLVAGLLMKVGGAPIIWTAITILFFRAYAKSDSLGRGERMSIPETGRIPLVALLAVVPLVAACAPEPSDGRAGTEVAGEWTAAGPIEVRGARIGLPPLPERAAGYLEIRNPGGTSVRIVGASPPEGVASVSIHRSEASSGMMSMAPAGPVEIGPGETVIFEPGGTHVMLEGIEATWGVGSEHAVTFVLEDGRESVVRFRVVPLAQLDAPAGG